MDDSFHPDTRNLNKRGKLQLQSEVQRVQSWHKDSKMGSAVTLWCVSHVSLNAVLPVETVSVNESFKLGITIKRAHPLEPAAWRQQIAHCFLRGLHFQQSVMERRIVADPMWVPKVVTAPQCNERRHLQNTVVYPFKIGAASLLTVSEFHAARHTTSSVSPLSHVFSLLCWTALRDTKSVFHSCLGRESDGKRYWLRSAIYAGR